MLSGDVVILENYALQSWSNGNGMKDGMPENLIRPPSDVLERVPDASYAEFRRGKDRACVDCIVATIDPNGIPLVALSKRQQGDCYAGIWWMHGGALPAYMPLQTFITQRVQKEVGVEVRHEQLVLVGVYRTCAHDYVDSSLQVCFAALLPYHHVRGSLKVDGGHEEVRLFTLQELNNIPPEESHWYPMRVANRVVRTLPYIPAWRLV